ncbi:uncharacterized protein LOC126100592 [Schistocerca cancellata]|uniref:uncharacterized protein LOC126100592 n=1 Tax=Schistocerca cancellata TaxID=274614 RepID=UPI0021193FBB|nr:uncharacterized protein LOC126100592 [Schistocerca cancellata]
MRATRTTTAPLKSGCPVVEVNSSPLGSRVAVRSAADACCTGGWEAVSRDVREVPLWTDHAPWGRDAAKSGRQSPAAPVTETALRPVLLEVLAVVSQPRCRPNSGRPPELRLTSGGERMTPVSWNRLPESSTTKIEHLDMDHICTQIRTAS